MEYSISFPNTNAYLLSLSKLVILLLCHAGYKGQRKLRKFTSQCTYSVSTRVCLCWYAGGKDVSECVAISPVLSHYIFFQNFCTLCNSTYCQVLDSHFALSHIYFIEFGVLI